MGSSQLENDPEGTRHPNQVQAARREDLAPCRLNRHSLPSETIFDR
jgi:hypothetical protein